MSTHIIQNISSNSYLLNSYLAGNILSLRELRLALVSQEKSSLPKQPDYFFKNWIEQQDCWEKGDYNYAVFLRKIFRELTNEILETRGKRIFIRTDAFTLWQDLILKNSPTVLQCAYIAQRSPNPFRDAGDLQNYIKVYLEPNFLNSSLPNPYIPQLDYLVETIGLSDLHMHLTNATESDHTWLHILKNPDVFYDTFRKAQNSKMEEFLFQVDPSLSVNDICDRLFLASDLRSYLCNHLEEKPSHDNKILTRDWLLKTVSIDTWRRERDSSQNTIISHPIEKFHPVLKHYQLWIQEALFLVLSFKYLEQSPHDEYFARGLHVYILLQGFFQTLMVQQKLNIGFDQFEKIVRTDIRDTSEKTFLERFKQLNGNCGDRLAFLEGRLSPKITVTQQALQLRNILHGYYLYSNDLPSGSFKLGNYSSWETKKHRMNLRLVAHFIKEEDKDFELSPDGLLVRHHALRNKLQQQARVLIQCRDHITPEGKLFITGIDAANNELVTPPEVFAPIFRYCRRHGITHRTFHAGEDFQHLLSGLRAIYEAAVFLDMRSGDRIGHATAAGIDPELWINRTGEEIAIAEGEWLDNLIFAASILRTSNKPAAGALLTRIHFTIEEIAARIYASIVQFPNSPNHSILENAWTMRNLDVLLLDEDETRKYDLLFPEDREEYEMVQEQLNKHPLAFNFLKYYHNSKISKAYTRKISVPLYTENNQTGRTYPLFSPQDLRYIQNLVLEELHRREIVLEVPLISNLRISFYQSPREHHLWRWFNLPKDNSSTHIKTPAVCLVSDDPGIFNTNIYNEYAHVFMVLTHEWEMDPNQAIHYIEQLIQNGFVYRFDSDVWKGNAIGRQVDNQLDLSLKSHYETDTLN